MLNQHQIASETKPLLSSNYFMSKPIFYKVFSAIFGAIKILEKLWRWGRCIQQSQSFETSEQQTIPAKLDPCMFFSDPTLTGWLWCWATGLSFVIMMNITNIRCRYWSNGFIALKLKRGPPLLWFPHTLLVDDAWP